MRVIWTFALLFITNCILAQGWHELGSDPCALKGNGSISTICIDSGGIIYASGGITDSPVAATGKLYVAKWDGRCWGMLGTDGDFFTTDGYIGAVCTDAHHNVYAGGCFYDSGRTFVAKFNGSQWIRLGGSDALHFNSCIDAMCVDALGNVYAAGEFSDSASPFSGNLYVAKWDGISWSMVGNNNIFAGGYELRSICTDKKGNLYVCGMLQDSGYRYIAHWDGTSWSKLGNLRTALHLNTIMLASDTANNIYATGEFQSDSGDYFLAKWNGRNWSAIRPDGIGYNCYAVTTNTKGDVFVSARYSGEEYVAKWDGVHWQKLGVGYYSLNANKSIWTIATDGNYHIYAAGEFTDSPSSEKGYTYVAEYDENKTAIAVINALPQSAVVYPNPADGVINIKIDAGIVGTSYILYSIDGGTVKRGILRGIVSTIDIHTLAAGTYLLCIENDPSGRFRIIKD